MFAKLFKYDFKRLKRFALPIILVLIIIAAVGIVNSAVMVNSIEDVATAPDGDYTAGISSFFMMGSTFGLFFSIMALVAVAAVFGVLVLVDYYKSTVSDEAYLTFTLPVKVRDTLLSKLLAASVWSLILIALVIASFFGIIFTVILSIPGSADINLKDVISQIFSENVGLMVLQIILYIVYGIASLVNSLLLYFMAITFSSTMARNHKLLCAIGCVIGVNFAYGILSNIISLIASAIGGTAGAVANSSFLMYNITTIVMIAVMIGLSFLFYFLTKYMLEKKLNLA